MIGHESKEVLLGSTRSAVGPVLAVAQSLTNFVVSNEFNITAAGSRNLRVKLVCGRVTVAAAISAKLQHWDGGLSTGSFQFTDTDVTAASDYITITGHGLADGDEIVFTSVNTLPAPLVAGTIYYAINNTANRVKVATTEALALAGTAIDITDAGSAAGAFIVTYTAKRWVTMAKTATTISANADAFIRFNVEVAGDQADLPLMPRGRVVITTGAGDSLQVSSVRVIQPA